MNSIPYLTRSTQWTGAPRVTWVRTPAPGPPGPAWASSCPPPKRFSSSPTRRGLRPRTRLSTWREPLISFTWATWTSWRRPRRSAPISSSDSTPTPWSTGRLIVGSLMVRKSVPDPDPYFFVRLGSGSVNTSMVRIRIWNRIRIWGIGFRSFHQQAKNLDKLWFLLFCDFNYMLSLKTDVTVRYLQ